jgi:hypothetical protein
MSKTPSTWSRSSASAAESSFPKRYLHRDQFMLHNLSIKLAPMSIHRNQGMERFRGTNSRYFLVAWSCSRRCNSTMRYGSSKLRPVRRKSKFEYNRKLTQKLENFRKLIKCSGIWVFVPTQRDRVGAIASRSMQSEPNLPQ